MEKRGRFRMAGWCLIIVLIVVSLPSAAGAGSLAQPGRAGAVDLLSSSESGLSWLLQVPTDRLAVEPVAVDGETFAAISLAGWGATQQAGAPELPRLVTAIGAPPGAEVRVQALPGAATSRTLPGRVLPVPTLEARWDGEALVAGSPFLPSLKSERVADPAVYGAGGSYPGTLAEVVSDGWVRGQRVVGIALYPVQYEPATGGLTVYENLEVQVRFEGAAAAGRPGGAQGPAHEALFESELLNYEAARNWASATEAAGPEAVPWMPPDPGFRVYVEEEGIYRLSYGELQAAGVLAGNPDPGTFRMYNMGQEVAIHVELGGDGNFGAGDYILFYGQAIASKYSRYNVYWLTHGQGTTKPMGSRDGSPSGGTAPATFDDLLHLEQNQYYVTSLVGDENLERFVWDYLYPPERNSWATSLSLTAPAHGSEKATLKILVHGGDLPDNASDPHRVQVYLNGGEVKDESWNGIGQHEIIIGNLSQTLLNAGSNNVELRAPRAEDLVYVDWLDLAFANTFVAGADSLAFNQANPGKWQFGIDAFSQSGVAVFDVTDPASVARILNGSVTPSGPSFSLAFTDQIAAPTRYLALASTAFLPAAKIERDTASNLQSAANGADYVLVTHRDFAAAVAPLAAYRAGQGLRVVQVDVQDAYDEFGYGLPSAQALRAFLTYAYDRWVDPAPEYVLLVGDGHYDPKDYGGHGLASYIPPYLAPVDPYINETAADNRYVSFTAGDEIPDMMLGRMAVNSAAEATVVVNKTLDYEKAPAPGSWNNRVLFVADDPEAGANYPKMSDDLIACCLPGSYGSPKVYYTVTHPTPAGARAAILSAISAGQLIVHYNGHALTFRWADESLFRSSDIPSLANGNRLPIMLPMTRYDGYFHQPVPSSQGSMGEGIVRADGKGAVASWSPAGVNLSTGQAELDSGFFDTVFKAGSRVAGQAATAGKVRLWATGKNQDLVDTFIFLGDPALAIHPLWDGASIFLPVIQRTAH